MDKQSFIKKLPGVFQTNSQEKFFNATFDQVFSKKENEKLLGFIGRRNNTRFDPVKDFYIPEPNKDRTWWQLEPTAYSLNQTTLEKENVFFYEDLLNRLHYYGGDIHNHDRLFQTEYYSFAPPIDFDKFVNYQDYYWVENRLPLISIPGITDFDIISDIIGESQYTSPDGIVFTSGLRVAFPDSINYTMPLTVEAVGREMVLVPDYPDILKTEDYLYLQWDNAFVITSTSTLENDNWDENTWEVQRRPVNGDYITIERGALDRNAWSRTNKWYHIDAIRTAVVATSQNFPNNATRALRPIIEFKKNIRLYKSGDKFKSEVNYVTTFLKSQLSGSTLTSIAAWTDIAMRNGDTIVFLEDDALEHVASSVKKNIYQVVVSAGDIVTFVPVTTEPDQVQEGDIIYVLQGEEQNETYYFEEGDWASPFQEKTKENQPPLFSLYDHNYVSLDNPDVYPESNFAGSRIFAYSVNTSAGAINDPILGFPLTYDTLAQQSDIIFENCLITERYNYLQNENIVTISGYYYYKNITENPVNDTYENTWHPYSGLYSKQRVVDRFVVGYDAITEFKLSVVPHGYPVMPDIFVYINSKKTEDYQLVEKNDGLYVVFTAQPATESVVELRTYTRQLLDPASRGYWEIPQQLEANPSNEEIGSLSASRLVKHFVSIIENQTNFEGNGLGGTDNYRDTKKDLSLGTYILQNASSLLKLMVTSSSSDMDPITAIRFNENEYAKYKSKYLSIAKRLINQKFQPNVNYSVQLAGYVDEIINEIIRTKEHQGAFKYSYMISFGKVFAEESMVVPTQDLSVVGNWSYITAFDNYINLSSVKNSLYLYKIETDGETLLVVDEDYRIEYDDLTISVRYNLSNVPANSEVIARMYQNSLPAYIPTTPTKNGCYEVYIPRIITDTSYATPTQVIVGHDGSKTVLYGDYRDDLLLELEKRIYNSLLAKQRNEYESPVMLENAKPGKWRDTGYLYEEFCNITESYLNKWSAKFGADYRTNEFTEFSAALPTSAHWMLWNYSQLYVDGNPLPGNWRGIFLQYYDTLTPATTPWEMLGFGEMPTWWIEEYGNYPWISSNPMWLNIANGEIVRGNRRGIDRRYMRPTLSAYMPITATGIQKTVTEIFNGIWYYADNPTVPVTIGGLLGDTEIRGYDADWKYGDVSPVENAWMNSSEYRFSTQEFLYLMKPGLFSDYLWDTQNTAYNPAEQYVSLDTFMRQKNSEIYVHGEELDNNVVLRYGYQTWISDRLLFLGKTLSSFGYKMRNANVNLGHKMAGFISKEQTKFYIESTSPSAVKPTYTIPSNNFDVILHTGQPVAETFYSGVVIRALASGEFQVYGYDLLNSEFSVYPRSELGAGQEITIGGTPASFTQLELGRTYSAGDIVRNNGVYYQCILTHTADRFFAQNWFKLSKLPIVGGVSATYNRIADKSLVVKVPYGAVLKNAQAVFDLIIGHGDYLEAQGWMFDTVDDTTNQLQDWLLSAKQFLMWLNTSWAPDASLQLSPLSNMAKITVNAGYPASVEKISNGVYSIVDKYGTSIDPINTVVDRKDRYLSVTPQNTINGGIYGLKVDTRETDHVVLFDNTTAFGDTIYNPVLRQRQTRLKFNGFRSSGWTGKMEAPGYLVIDDELVPNFDSIVENVRYYYDSNYIVENQSIETLGMHLIGHNTKEYLDNLQIEDDIQYLFYQGMIRQKGTRQSFDKLFRSKEVQAKEEIEVYEEWALKLGDFGTTVENVNTEFIVNPETRQTGILTARLNYTIDSIGFVAQIGLLNTVELYAAPPALIIQEPAAGIGNRVAKAVAILGTDKRISEIVITDPGFGYTFNPTVVIDELTVSYASRARILSAEPNKDMFYSVYQGEVTHDTTRDNIIDIDINDSTAWTSPPEEANYAAPFPKTSKLDFGIANAGYVHKSDIKYMNFSAKEFNTWAETGYTIGDTIWVAKTVSTTWTVLKAFGYAANTLPANTLGFIDNAYRLRTDDANNLYLQILTSVDRTVGASTVTYGTYPSLMQENHLPIASARIHYDTVLGKKIYTHTQGGICLQAINGSVVENNYKLTYYYDGKITETEIDTNTNTISYTYTYEQYNLLDENGLAVDPGLFFEAGGIEGINKLVIFKALRFSELPVLSAIPYIENGDKLWVDFDNVSKWTVYNVDAGVAVPHRKQEDLIDTALFESIQLYRKSNQQIMAFMPVYDPFKNIFFGPVEKNIRYKTQNDPARYNNSANPALYNPSNMFGKDNVGEVWWDMSNIRYMYYEQSASTTETSTDVLEYRRDNWGSYFPGSRVEVYEWVESSVLPQDYTGGGTPKSNSEYVSIARYNAQTSVTETIYYYWVSGKITIPNANNRSMSISGIQNILTIKNPRDFIYFAPIQDTGANSSLICVNANIMFVEQGSTVQLKYKKLRNDNTDHTEWKLFRTGDPLSVVHDKLWDKFVDSICGYTQEIEDSGIYSNPIHLSNGNIILPVPDPLLSTRRKYGVKYRPRQSMFVDIYGARKVFAQAINELLVSIQAKDDRAGWDADVTTNAYWQYIDWVLEGEENTQPTVQYVTLPDLSVAFADGAQVGDVLLVSEATTDMRYAYYKIISTESYQVIRIQNSTIQIKDILYTEKNVYALSVELRELITAIVNNVFTIDKKVNTNLLYSAMVYYALSEQKIVDWVFKTSYIYVRQSGIELTQDANYSANRIDNVIDYINEAKPYHTKLREYTNSYSKFDLAEGTAFDFLNSKLTVNFSAIECNTHPGMWDEDGILEWDIRDKPWDDTLTCLPPFKGVVLDSETFVWGWESFEWDSRTVVSVDDPYGWDNEPPIQDFVSGNRYNSEDFVETQVKVTTPDDTAGEVFSTTELIYPAGNNMVIPGGQSIEGIVSKDGNKLEIDLYNPAPLLPGSGDPEVTLGVIFDGKGFRNATARDYPSEFVPGKVSGTLVINVDTKLPNLTDVSNPYSDIVSYRLYMATYGLLRTARVFRNSYIRQTRLEFGLDLEDLTIRVTNAEVLFPTDINDNPIPPTADNPYYIWVGGERIAYRYARIIDAGLPTEHWLLGAITRGCDLTSPKQHPADTKVYSANEEDEMTIPGQFRSNWAEEMMPDYDESLQRINTEFGGLWHSDTPAALFLKEGRSQYNPTIIPPVPDII